MLDDLDFMEWHGQDPRLESLLEDVIVRISKKHRDQFPFFDVFEEPSKWGAYVEPGRGVILDAAKLAAEPYQVAVGTIAHELAHVALCHPRDGWLEDEYAADDLARQWGLSKEVDEMRRAYGPPTLE